MGDQNKNVPRLRFPGYTDAWVKCELKDVAEIYDGTHQTPKYQSHGIMFLSVENITNLSSKKYISQEAFDSEFLIRPEKGDVLMTRIGDIGTANVVESEQPIAYYVSLALFKSTKLNPYFLKNIIHSPETINDIWRRTLHIAFPKKINKNEIGNVSIFVPTIDEQTKIGYLFNSLDNLITVNERELNKLKDLKKSYLEKMFPKNGSDIPELRFPGYADAWVKCELGDVVDIVGGGTPSTSVIEYWNGEINWYSPVEIGNQIYVSNSQNKITKLGLEKSSAKILPAYKTILFTSRAGIGNTAIITSDGATNQGFQSLVIKEKMDLYFLYTTSYKIKEMALQIASGSTFLEISGKSLSKLEILLPNFEEQTKIGEFFKHLDDLITVNERELNKLKELKKSYLKDMFV